ncbi:MAG: hypothetical protein ACI88G_000897, partial [Woeseiaceae bacterium]
MRVEFPALAITVLAISALAMLSSQIAKAQQ